MPAGVDPDGNPEFALDPHHLHIWPRHSFMLMALPNQVSCYVKPVLFPCLTPGTIKDKSFTATLFAPNADFAKLNSRTDFIQWMNEQFPDAVPLIGESALSVMWDKNPRSPLITVKVRHYSDDLIFILTKRLISKATPYHYKDRVIIIGDAAHSQVPFYGQGLNCGLEDVRVLDSLLREQCVDPTDFLAPEKYLDSRLSSALSKYTETRHDDLVAICELAMNQ